MIGQTLGRYQIVERLGEGGMGVVFRANDPRLERDVALKVLKQDALHDEDSKRRFRLEARALSQLLHPNIATLFDFDSDRGVDFLVLEFVPGESLAHTLRNGPLPETRARAIALDVAEGRQSAHEKGIVHRDLKPGNIIITPRERAKVLDFGLARVMPEAASLTQSSSISGPGALVGTVPYMSPEQVRDGRADASSDLCWRPHIPTAGSRAIIAVFNEQIGFLYVSAADALHNGKRLCVLATVAFSTGSGSASGFSKRTTRC